MNNYKLCSIVKKSSINLKENDSIQTALNTMIEHMISSVIITNEHNQPIGIFTEHDSLKIIANKEALVSSLGEVMSRDVFSVQMSANIHDAYVCMEEKGYKHLIVVDEENIFQGIVTEGDFIRHMGFEALEHQKLISEAMNKAIVKVSCDSTIYQVAELMNSKKSDYAIVIRNDKPCAIINERDIAHYCVYNSLDEDISISHFDNCKMHIIEKNRSTHEATAMMQSHGVHQLAVLDESGQLTGLITRHDILKSIHGSYFDFLLQVIEDKTAKEQKLQAQAKELEKLANYDLLTNLPNRLLFKDLLKKSIANASRNNYVIAVILLDLDRFKDVNDSYGHAMGDELIKRISTNLVKSLREGDLIARLGGDEFGIILEHISNQDYVAKVTQNILNTISHSIVLSNAAEINIESSAGIVIAPTDTKEADKVLQYADNALSQAKKDGHGFYRFYTEEMLQKAINKTAYEHSLRIAIENKELELYYQPQVHIATGKIIGAEALCRWNLGGKGMVSPEIFIPIADESGLINQLGEWIVDEVCRQGKEWLDNGYNLTLALNVSANQVKYQNIPELISQALLKHNYPAQKLEIEITESSLMQKAEEAIDMLHAIRAKGVRIAIDDFGTGYSSLSYLKDFPIDVLKIDKKFIDDVPYTPSDCALVKAIIEMGKALSFQVLAEGIEQQEQLSYLKNEDCHVYQGFLKSKPIPAKDFEALLGA